MANLTDADKVLRNDTGKDIVTQLTAIKTAIENGGGGGGGDYANKNIAVTFDTETSYNEGDYVIYNSDLYRAKNDVSAGTWSGSTDWESVTVGEQLNLKAFTVVCTQSQYDTWSSTTPKSFPLLNAYYIITDAPNLNPTANDIEYSSGVTVKQAVDGKADKVTSVITENNTVTLADSTFGTVVSKVLNKGVYIITGTVNFSSDANGNRIIILATTETSTNDATNSIVTTGRATLQRTMLVNITGTTATIYLRGFQSSGSSMTNVKGYIEAVKIA